MATGVMRSWIMIHQQWLELVHGRGDGDGIKIGPDLHHTMMSWGPASQPRIIAGIKG